MVNTAVVRAKARERARAKEKEKVREKEKAKANMTALVLTQFPQSGTESLGIRTLIGGALPAKLSTSRPAALVLHVVSQNRRD